MLAGAIQGLVFSVVVIFSDKYHNSSIKFLTALIISFSYDILQYYFYDTRIIKEEIFYHIVYTPISSLCSAFLYFYVFKLLFPKERITWRQKLLYLPFIIFFTISFFIKIVGVLRNNIDEKINRSFWDFYFFEEIFSVLFSCLSLILCFLLIKKYEKHKAESNQLKGKIHLKWLKLTLSVIFITILASWSYLTYMDIYVNEPKFYLLWIGMSVTIYWLGHIGIYKFGINEEREQIRNYSFSTKKPIEKIKISDTVNKNIPGFVKFIVEDKNYMDSSLTLEKTADNLNLSPSYLSRIINQEMGITFTDFVNKKRVEEAASYLTNPEFSNYTLVAIGLEAGFNSKSAFNSSFKKITGKTPGEFRKELLTTADRSDALNFEFSNEN